MTMNFEKTLEEENKKLSSLLEQEGMDTDITGFDGAGVYVIDSIEDAIHEGPFENFEDSENFRSDMEEYARYYSARLDSSANIVETL